MPFNSLLLWQGNQHFYIMILSMPMQSAHLWGFRVRYMLLSFAFWLAGFALTFALYASIGHTQASANGPTFSLNGVSLFHSDNLFLFILVNNLVVALILSLGGYFTGGLLTLVFNVWNGVFFGLIFQVALRYLPAKLWVISVYGPVELFAFAQFSAFGLEGFANVKRIAKSLPLQTQLHRTALLRLWLPLVLLIIAALLETLTTKL
jgi:uncharacterized membrane protein SpoIIM required for sporulation